MVNKKVFATIFLTITTLILLTSMSFASYSTVQMTVVEEPVATIQFGSNSKFEKKLISKDLNNKEVTLQLQVTNEEDNLKPTGELVLVLDNSASMLENISGGNGEGDDSEQGPPPMEDRSLNQEDTYYAGGGSTIRKDIIFNAAQSLITNLLDGNDNLKIGIVSFSTSTDVSQEGTSADANVVSALSSNASTLNNAIDTIEANGPRTDLEAGLDLASKQFSSDATNKYMIVLTDGIPNVSLGHNNPYYSDDTINATNAKLKEIESSNIKLITMLTGIDDENYVPTGTTKNFAQIISEVFGSSTTPTAGDFYYVTDDQAEKTITTDIYNSLLPTSQTYKDIKVVDYFPQEIIDNFDFAYVSDANIGTVTAEVDKTNNSITWTIPELASGQTATVQYKLKLKEDFDESIVDKILDTNKKVDITYKDFNDDEQEKTTDVTPKLKLTEPKTPPTELPKAGSITLITAFIVAIGLFAFSIIKLKIYNKNVK